MSYREEFPDFKGKLLIPEGFVDDSWHNDEMPKASKTINTGRNGEETEINVIIWQNDDEKSKKYIYEVDVNGEMVASYATDDVEEIRMLITPW